MKKMTSVFLGLSLISASVFAGQIHMTADSAGREYYSMPQHRSEIKTHEIADQDMLDIEARATQNKKNIVVGGVIIQLETLASGKINLLSVGKHKFKAEFKSDNLNIQNLLVALTDKHEVYLSYGEGLKKIGGIQGILDFLYDKDVHVDHKYLSMMNDENDNVALVLMDTKSQILGVESLKIK